MVELLKDMVYVSGCVGCFGLFWLSRFVSKIDFQVSGNGAVAFYNFQAQATKCPTFCQVVLPFMTSCAIENAQLHFVLGRISDTWRCNGEGCARSRVKGVNVSDDRVDSQMASC